MRTTKSFPGRVFVSRQDVENFNSKWPCSPIPEKACFFDFQKGDLVDMSDHLRECDGAALLALSQDAQAMLP
jgi:hypothetical protein